MKKTLLIGLFAAFIGGFLVQLQSDSTQMQANVLLSIREEQEEDSQKWRTADRFKYELIDKGDEVIYLDPGEEKTLNLTLKNTGKSKWYFDEGIEQKLVLGVLTPTTREDFFDSSKLLVEDSDGKTSIAPYDSTTIEIPIKAPAVPGIYKEEIKPLIDGLKWLSENDKEKIVWYFVVGGDFTQSYAYELSNGETQSQGALNITIPKNGSKEVTLKLKNTGETSWYDDGPFPIKLVTEDEKAVQNFMLTESVVADLQENTVNPGETGTFRFEINAPASDVTSYTLPLKLSIPGLLTFATPPVNLNITVSNKVVALTFDDGYGDIGPFIDVLNEQGVRGTFFMLGVVAQNRPDEMKRIVDEGHLLANHSYDHPDFRGLSAGEIRWQLDAGRQAIIDATGGYDPAPYFRYPYGARSSATDAVLTNDGWYWYQWTNGTGDFNYHENTAAGRSHILYYATAYPPERAIVLMHIISRSTLAVLPDIIQYYKDNGYAFVTVDEL